MCGFIGLFSNNPVHQNAFSHGLRAIEARGRTTDVLKHEDASFGYCRLPTDDVTNDQLNTIVERDGTITLFNGLITNTSRLAEQYSLSPESAGSDSLCLGEGVSKNGTEFLRHCRGMFACAFIQENRIILARDTVGVKPLYFIDQPDLFAFASELKALTPFGVDVQELLPGQTLVYDRVSRQSVVRNFSYAGEEGAKSLERRLEEAVVEPTRRYLANSQRRVAVLLSGGVDSSIIAQMLVNELRDKEKNRLIGFCIGEAGTNDIRVAEKLAKHLNLQLVHVTLPAPEILLRQMPDIVQAVESPHARVVKVALLYEALAEAIRQRDIDIVIGGEGADELFFGYHRFIDGLSHDQSDEVFRMFYKHVFYNTLLQRYERVFARKQIEGRVPFLDQEVVAIAEKLAPDSKVKKHADGTHTSKLPLRELAKAIGLPGYVYDRPKEKMTSGATGKDNAGGDEGFLEAEARSRTGHTFQGLVDILYRLYYHHPHGDALQRGKDFKTEEDIMDLVRQYQSIETGSIA